MAIPPRPDPSSPPQSDNAPVVAPDPAMEHTLRLLDVARGDGDGRGIVNTALDSLRAGANVNYPDPATGLTALHYAVAYDKVDLVRLIVQARSCDFTIKDRKGRTAATLAYEVAQNSVMGRFLLAKEMRQRRARDEIAADDQSEA